MYHGGMKRSGALCLAGCLAAFCVSAARAQTVIRTVPGLGAQAGAGAAGALGMSPSLNVPAAVGPTLSLPAPALPVLKTGNLLPSLNAPVLETYSAAPVASRSGAPALRRAPPVEESRGRTAAPVSERLNAVLGRVADKKAVSAAAAPEVRSSKRSSALGRAFDGKGRSAAAADGVVPAFGDAGAQGAAQLVHNGYGFYSWIKDLPEVAGAPRPALAAARILEAGAPLLAKGPVIAMKGPGSLTLLAAEDATVQPVVVPLDAVEASPQAALLADKIELAASRDEAERTFTNTAALMNRLAEVLREAPPEIEKPPSLAERGEMPIDPLRQPMEYVTRMLRDAMRSEDPYETLAILRRTRKEARSRLDYQRASKFLESLRSQAELRAHDFVPGLLTDAQRSAGDNDREAVDRIFDAALEFVEYAPGWKKRVNEARKRAYSTLDLLEEFGLVDPETGLPVKSEEPAEDLEAEAQAAEVQ